MPLIKDKQVIDNDWLHADESGELPSGRVTVPLKRWLDRRDVEFIRLHRIHNFLLQH